MSPRVVASEGCAEPSLRSAALCRLELIFPLANFETHGYSFGGELAIIDVDMAQAIQNLHTDQGKFPPALLQKFLLAHDWSPVTWAGAIERPMVPPFRHVHVPPFEMLLPPCTSRSSPPDTTSMCTRWGAAALYKRLAAGDIYGSLLQNDRKLTGMPANHFQGGNEVIWGNFPRAPTAPDSLGRFFLM
ncbi:hypothetical protein GGX14DRAFT_407796 [Mycena pura]|uniref:Uncharacterized protein n=1 Tax=Mycena pura TaxID=153505 RepID=A0AAD6UMC7_9AGAR|nr:hypothetical protein GGX14DRAFT_407796 [Mycena pura]